MDDVLLSMSDYIKPGGRVIIMSELSIEVRNSRLNANVAFGPQTYEIKHEIGSTTSIHSLRRLPLNEACAVIVLPDTAHEDDPKKSDSACLATTITVDSLLKGLHPQFFQPKGQRPRLICEVLSPVIERALH